MTIPGDPTEHFWRTQGVARALDISFTEAMRDGRLTEADYAGLVARCCLCTHRNACLAWLARNGASASSAPPFCANREVLEALARPN